MMIEEREKKNKRIAAATSIGVHVALLIIFLFAVAWRAPDPPLPEFGIQLNFGLDAQGSGDVQQETPVGSDEKAEETDQAQEVQQEKVSESQPAETTPVEQPVTNKLESPEVVKEEKKENKPVDKPKEKVVEKKEEKIPVKEEVKTAYKPNAEKTESKTGKPGSQGDDTDKAGDKGDPKGTLDANALYGKAGGGAGGSSLDLAGWKWDEIPKPNVPNNESGRVVFEIKVDDAGEIISIRTIERSVSLEAENICRKEIEKLTFTKSGANVPSVTTGKITFVVRSN
jgi:outer membrane biosynthesis protein TonB